VFEHEIEALDHVVERNLEPVGIDPDRGRLGRRSTIHEPKGKPPSIGAEIVLASARGDEGTVRRGVGIEGAAEGTPHQRTSVRFGASRPGPRGPAKAATSPGSCSSGASRIAVGSGMSSVAPRRTITTAVPGRSRSAASIGAGTSGAADAAPLAATMKAGRRKGCVSAAAA